MKKGDRQTNIENISEWKLGRKTRQRGINTEAKEKITSTKRKREWENFETDKEEAEEKFG
jgi:hypothetical protein